MLPTDVVTPKNILVTGGAGFIGSAVVRALIASTPHRVLNLDKLTYAGSLDAVAGVADDARYAFVEADVCDAPEVRRAIDAFRPDAVLHLAAESHVDRSISTSAEFVRTNVVGTHVLLECVRDHYERLDAARQAAFRFLHVSTDEVFGSSDDRNERRDERAAYRPSSPYSATKAAADHLVQAWHRTYGLPTLVTRSCNNYGPFQTPEKLVPRMILNAIEGRPLPLYGDGLQVRDWLFVDDHAHALLRVLERGTIGSSYNLTGNCELTNLAMLQRICTTLERLRPARPHGPRSYAELIEHTTDRAGHDRRYGVDGDRARAELGWRPRTTLTDGLADTVAWYVDHLDWCRAARARAMRASAASPTAED